jgi:hypothetical protein
LILGAQYVQKGHPFGTQKRGRIDFSGFCCQQGRHDIHIVKPTCFEENPGRRLSKNVIIIEFGQQKRCWETATQKGVFLESILVAFASKKDSKSEPNLVWIFRCPNKWIPRVDVGFPRLPGLPQDTISWCPKGLQDGMSWRTSV